MIWAFSCQLGLPQQDCGAYTPDESARGFRQFSGCPSCKYREAGNAETQAAEFAQKQHTITTGEKNYETT